MSNSTCHRERAPEYCAERSAGARSLGFEIDRPAVVYENHSQDCRYKELTDVSESVTAKYGTGGNNMPVVVEQPILLESNQNHAGIKTDGISPALPASAGMGGGYVPMVVAQNWDGSQVAPTLTSVRRLTPLECERLQGFPDGWTDIGDWIDSKGKLHKSTDSARYKALGNSIALPFWDWLAARIVAQYDRPTTMASLFDGIGGFPLVFSRYGCVPIWASEIEEFPIAVTKKRFED